MDQQFATDWLQVACPIYKVKGCIKSMKFCPQWFKRWIFLSTEKSTIKWKAHTLFNKRGLYTSVKRFNLTLSFTSQHYTFASTT